jgi:hypothetical protein
MCVKKNDKIFTILNRWFGSQLAIALNTNNKYNLKQLICKFEANFL